MFELLYVGFELQKLRKFNCCVIYVFPLFLLQIQRLSFEFDTVYVSNPCLNLKCLNNSQPSNKLISNLWDLKFECNEILKLKIL